MYLEYQRRLLEAGALDFDDLLTLTVRLFHEHPEAAELARPVPPRARRRVPGHQRRAVELVGCSPRSTATSWWWATPIKCHPPSPPPPTSHPPAVHHNFQPLIYKFRGADFRNLLRFEEVFPRRTVIVLEQNYRSTQRILDAANAVIANNAARRPKHLWTEQIGGELITRYHAEDEHDEAAYVVHEDPAGRHRREHRFGDVAVFYRTNARAA